MKKLLATLLFLSLSFSLIADHHGGSKDEEKIVYVNGMVCAFCAQGIERNFKREKAISDIKVELEDHKVTLSFKPGKTLSENRIAEILEAAGYTVDDTRTH